MPECSDPCCQCKLQETASLYEEAELQHVYTDEYAAEYELEKQGAEWRLAESTVTL